MARLRIAAALPLLAAGHMAMIIPTTRNAMDRNLSEFQGGKSPSCACTCADGKECDMGARAEGGSGQPCLWWSQGCSIGCSHCVTDPRHPANHGKIPSDGIEGAWPHTDKAGFRTAYCDEPGEPVLPREYWTLNTRAVEGAVNDSYRFNPWRAPGTAPVVDPCGQAGGKYPQTPMGGDSVFFSTEFAKMGDLGSKLPPTSGDLPTWEAGSDVQVAWGMRFNHGGGYQYRLCPADGPLTEECFQQTPLDFVRDAHAIMWNNGTMYPIKGMFVDDSVCPVVPRGSTWARNPIPRVHTDNIGMAFVGRCTYEPPRRGQWSAEKEDCQQFPSPCPELDKDWYDASTFDHNDHEGACSGDWTLGMVADRVIIPQHIKPGRYVLGWRMDCEETAQVWQNCADVNIVSTITV